MTSPKGVPVEDKNLFVDPRLESYESFFDHAWAGSLLKLVEQTKLYPIAFDLCTDWKSVANTFRFPWLLMFSLENFKNGFIQTNEPFLAKLTRGFREFLLNGVGSSFSLTKRKQLIALVDKVSQGVQEGIKNTPSPVQIGEIWREHVKIPEFILSIWGSQRLCYGSVYYAYENFLRRCVEVAKATSNYRPRNRDLQADLNNLLGSNMGDICLADANIEIARLVRHTLAHNGGLLTPELGNRDHGLKVQEGIIHIMPENTRCLFDLLKARVRMLAEKAVSLPQFKA